jgi:DNA invertase Pin-like site-specific DNA recombinase
MRLIEQRGWTFVTEFVDNDLSARRHNRRPGFDSLMQAVESGSINAIVVSEMPRLSRNRRDDLRLVETCQPRQVVIAVVRGSDIDLSTAAGRLVADMMASVARHEIEVKGERHRRQIQQSAQAGKPGSGRRAFGFMPNGLDHHPDEAKLVKELFDRFLAGAGLGELADWLNRQDVQTPSERKWTPGSVKVVLRNPRYAGIRGMRPVVEDATGRRSEWFEEIAPGQWQKIVSEDKWRAAVARLKSAMLPGLAGRTGPTPRYLLSGLAECGICGAHVISSTTGHGKNHSRTYRCSSQRHLVRRAEYIDDFVHLLIVRRLSRPDAIDLLAAPPDRDRLHDAQIEVTAVRERLQHLAVEFADGEITPDQMRVGTERGRLRLAELEAEIAAAGQTNHLASLIVAGDANEVSARWQKLPLSSQRAVIRQLMRVVILRGRVGRPPQGDPFDPGTVDITWI